VPTDKDKGNERHSFDQSANQKYVTLKISLWYQIHPFGHSQGYLMLLVFFLLFTWLSVRNAIGGYFVLSFTKYQLLPSSSCGGAFLPAIE
jgi:hypothetical protein